MSSRTSWHRHRQAWVHRIAAPLMALALVSLVSSLAGCGGGGGGGEGSASGGNPAPSSGVSKEDIYPTGERIDAKALNLFPLGAGDSWDWNIEIDGAKVGTAYRRVQLPNSYFGLFHTAEVHHQEYLPGDSFYEFRYYVKDSAGLSVVGTRSVFDGRTDAFNGVWPMREFDEPLLPQGKVRKLTRSGSSGADIDGDGVHDLFRYQHEQIFAGFETLTISGKTMTVARFSSTETLTIQPSREGSAEATASEVLDTYLAPGFGPVKLAAETRGSNGALLQNRRVYTMTKGTVGGKDWETFLASK